jgi:hypothetical protein
MAPRTIFLFGQSMLLTVVAASLSQSTSLRVFQAPTWAEVVSLAEHYTPDALIYDLPGAAESHILPLLSKNPRLLLIGLDGETNRAVLHAGRETKSLTLEWVKETIEKI